MRALSLLFLVALVAVSIPLKKIVRAQTTTVLGDGQAVGALGPHGAEVHPYLGDEVSYVAVSNLEDFSGLCAIYWSDDTYEVEGDDDLREVTSLSRNRVFLFASSPTHVHVLRFTATGVTWEHKVAVVQSPVAKLEPLGDTAGFHAFVRPYDTMTPHFQPTGSWERWEGGVKTGSLGPTMFGTPSMGWMGIGLVTLDSSHRDVVGIPNLQLTPTTRVPFSGCRWDGGEDGNEGGGGAGGWGYPEPCDVDAYEIVPAVDVNSSATTAEVEAPFGFSTWSEQVLIPLRTFSIPNYPGILTVLAKQLSPTTNISNANVEFYLSSVTFEQSSRNGISTYSWVETGGVSELSALTQITGVCDRLGTVVNSTYLDFNMVQFELSDDGKVLAMYCGGTKRDEVGAPNKVYAIEPGMRAEDNLVPIEVPDWSSFDVTGATISGDVAAPTPEEKMTVSMSKPVLQGMTYYWRVCDEMDCARVEYAPAVDPSADPVVTLGDRRIGDWRRSSIVRSPSDDPTSALSSSPSIPLASLTTTPFILHQEADSSTIDPYLRFRCAYGACLGESFDLELERVASPTSPDPLLNTVQSWSGTLPADVVEEGGVWVGSATFGLDTTIMNAGSISFISFDPSDPLSSTTPSDYTKTFAFHDSSDFPEGQFYWHAVVTDPETGKPALFVYCPVVSPPGEVHVVNISGGMATEMAMPGLLVPSSAALADETVVELGWEESLEITTYDTVLTGEHAGETIFAHVGDSSVQFFTFDPTDSTADPNNFFGFPHGLSFDSDFTVKWVRLDAVAGLFLIYLENDGGDDDLTVFKITNFFDEDLAEVLEPTSLLLNAYRSTNRQVGDLAFGANHLFVPDVRGVARYAVSRTTGSVSADDLEYLSLPGAKTRDWTDGWIRCSPLETLCVAVNLNEIFVIVHTLSSTGSGLYDAVIHQHLLLPDLHSVTAATNRDVPSSPISFSPDGTTVAIIAAPRPADDPLTGLPLPETIHLFEIQKANGTLLHRASQEVGYAIQGGLTWRPDSRSILFLLSNMTLVDWTLYAPAGAPTMMPTSRSDMYAPFTFQVAVNEECTFAHVTLTADMNGETAGTTSTIYFTEVMPDNGIEGGMLTFSIDPCMLDNSRTVPETAGTYAGTTGSPTQEGDVMFTVTCTTPTGQSTTSESMALYLKCMPTAYSKGLEYADPFVIIVIVLCSLVILAALGVGVQVTLTGLSAKAASSGSSVRATRSGLYSRVGAQSEPSLDPF